MATEQIAFTAGREQSVGIWTRLKRLPWLSLGIIAITVLAALIGPFFIEKSPYAVSLPNRLVPPMPLVGANPEYILGTDSLGRDMIARLVYGARVSLTIGCLALLTGGGFGLCIGIAAGYLGGRVDAIISRAIDGALALPSILIAMLFAVAVGPSLQTVVIAIAAVLWARFARIIRGEVLSIKELDYIAQARIAGCSRWRIMIVHVLANVLNTFTVLATLQVGSVILLEATLSFLGAGMPPPNPSWGQMVSEGREFLGSAWWVALFPGIAIGVVVLALNDFGDWLRDALDPKLRQV